MKLSRAIALLTLAVALITGCGGSEETGTSAREATRPKEKAAENVPAYADASDWAKLKKVVGAHAGKLLIPEGRSPERVVIRDVKRGSGPALQPGGRFTANYVVFDYATGKVIEDRWRIPPESFSLDVRYLVDAWMPGLTGVRAGGLRELIAPSSLAYGNGPLVYLVKVLEVEPG
jgi:peptidylprolyl isomerase